MKHPLLFALGFIVAISLGVLVFAQTYNSGRIYGQQLVSHEAFRDAQASLQGTNLTPQTREYLKAQFYYYGCQIQQDIIHREKVVDYGPVNDALLNGLVPFIPHGDSPDVYYQELKRIHAAR